MTRHFGLLIVALAALAVSSCATTTMNISSHVAPGLDISRFHSYDWGPADALPTGDPRLDKNAFFRDHLEGAVEKQMAARGFDRSTTPDLLIHYHANISERIDVDKMEKQYGYCQTDDCLIQYEAGTLMLDVIDTHTNRLIWRGWAQDSVEDTLDNHDKMAKQIDQAVTGMFALFPRGLGR